MSILAILAHDSEFGIGNKNELPWPTSKSDMERFREITTGSVVIMGRKTWESIGSNKLPNRINVVITGEPDMICGSVDWAMSGDMKTILDTLKILYPQLDLCIIGGSDIYQQALEYCDMIYQTEFHSKYETDTSLNLEEYLTDFEKIEEEVSETETFRTWKRM